MMKQTKKGFSLAELLITVGIISVIATLGFNITKRGVERAYDLLIYNGYKSLHDSILNANLRSFRLEEGIEQTPSIFKDSNKLKDFYINRDDFWQEVFVRNLNAPKDNNSSIYRAKNGITYEVNTIVHGELIDQTNNTLKKNREAMSVAYITMTVPDTNNSSTCFMYSSAGSQKYEILVPVDNTVNYCLGQPNLDLRHRIDLLPFYIDDGESGRFIPEKGYVKNIYRSADDALCSVYKNKKILTIGDNASNVTQYDCNNRPGAAIVGSIKPAHPNKVR